MTSDSNATGDWSAAIQKAQADMLRQWTEMSQAWAAGGAAGAAAPAAAAAARTPRRRPEDLRRALPPQCWRYLGGSGAPWGLVKRSAARPGPAQRHPPFRNG